MAELDVRGISKRFGQVVAAAGVTFTVERQELVALLGPSGCGKTTVLRVVAGLEVPDRGQVMVGGRDVTHLPPEARRVGLVFQNYALFPHLSVAGNVAYGLRRRRERGRVDELLSLVGLTGYGRRRIHQLSEGQRQRVALARALAPRPRVLLLDEPLSALDAALRKQLRTELRALLGELGIAAVHVTHDQEEALAVADRVGVMREGHILQMDHPQDLYHRPATPFVATFLGRANLWPGRVVSAGPGGTWVEVGGRTFAARGGGLSSGDRVFLFFRPEAVAVGDGPYRAQVKRAEFLGDRWEVHAQWQNLPLLLLCPEHPPQVVSFAPPTPLQALSRSNQDPGPP
ncbi:MAG: ABC transporter ATP-binding protein [Candidatus Bipolaricaulaceae bacterium]